MKKTFRFLSMAALALMGAMMTSCSSEDNIISEPQQPQDKANVVTLTTTVNFDDAAGAATRALDINYTDKKLTKTFAAGDYIAVIYENTSGNKVKAVSEALTAGGKSATFTVTLTNPKENGSVKYIYPAAMAGDTDVDYSNLNEQDGTLATIASKYDLAVFDGSLSGTALPALASLANKLAIIAYTIKDNAATPNDLTSGITGMTVSDGTNSYAVTRSADDGPIYVAIQPTGGANIEYTATDGSKYYAKSVTGKTYVANNFYQQGLLMTKVAEAVNLGLPSGVKWANVNVGATSVTDYGKYFAWGATTDNLSVSKPYSWDNTPFYTGNGSTHSWSKYGSDPATLEASDDAARAIWGGSWRMPTMGEFEELLTNTSQEWVANFNSTGVGGYKFTNKTDESKFIFLPAAGNYSGTSRYSSGYGYYWSSTLNSEKVSEARRLEFSSGIAPRMNAGNDYRYYGFPIRPVLGN